MQTHSSTSFRTQESMFQVKSPGLGKSSLRFYFTEVLYLYKMTFVIQGSLALPDHLISLNHCKRLLDAE